MGSVKRYTARYRVHFRQSAMSQLHLQTSQAHQILLALSAIRLRGAITIMMAI